MKVVYYTDKVHVEDLNVLKITEKLIKFQWNRAAGCQVRKDEIGKIKWDLYHYTVCEDENVNDCARKLMEHVVSERLKANDKAFHELMTAMAESDKWR